MAVISHVRTGWNKRLDGPGGVLVRLDEAEFASLDKWISQRPEGRLSRPSAIRQLLGQALLAEPAADVP